MTHPTNRNMMRRPAAIRKRAQALWLNAVWLAFTLGLAPGGAFGQTENIEGLIETRWKPAVTAIGGFFFWMLIAVGIFGIGKGLYEVVLEWRKGDQERKEWRKPLGWLIGGAAVTAAPLIVNLLASTVTGQAPVNPFQP